MLLFLAFLKGWQKLDINRVVEVKKLGGSMLWNDRAADKDWILLKTSL